MYDTIIPALRKINEAEIVWIVDTSINPAKMMSKKDGTDHSNDFKQLIDKNELDAVCICTPPSIRENIIEYAAENDLSIFCEPPMTDSLSSAERIKKIIEKNDTQFMMGFKLRFMEWYQNAYRLIQEKKLGEVIFLRSVFASQLPIHPWFLEESGVRGGIMLDIGANMFDMVTWLLGYPEKVSCDVTNIRSMKVEENAFVTFTHKNCVSQLALSYGVNIHANRPINRMEIYGTACYLIIDHTLNQFSFVPASGNILKDYTINLPVSAMRYYLAHKNLINKEDVYYKQLKYFVDCVAQGLDITPNHLDGIANVEIIDDAYKSAKINSNRNFQL